MATNQDQNKGRQSTEKNTGTEQRGRQGEPQKSAGMRREDDEDDRSQSTNPGQTGKDTRKENDENRRGQKGNTGNR